MSTVSKIKYGKVMTIMAKSMGLETGDQAFLEGTGLKVVEDWTGPGEHAIVGEGGKVPYGWTIQMSCDEGVVSKLDKMGIFAEAYDGCVLRLYRI